MTLIRLTILLLMFSSVSFGQDFRFQSQLSHPIKFGAENKLSQPKPYRAGQVDSVKVVAILAQFQEDNDNRSTGNGLFDRSNKYFNASLGKDTVVDAPPYDSAYFADHLVFLKNYYEKASKGKLKISFDLYGTVIQLPNKMESYSPQRNENNQKLGNLYNDAWSRADNFINFSQYQNQNTAFVIFHAGVGRDVDLSSIFGFDPTPYDIPSVYLGLKNLKEFFGSGYNGYQTSEGTFIQNSLIIPSTELRELSLLSGNTLLELGMNGILTASFGSFLGLPDLFNTSDGKTGIGRFGLMDGQSLFSYNGIFPPEPSAWEKIFLGWVRPVTVSSGSSVFRIPTSSKYINRDTTIYKVLISSKEYFLLENRNRDPEGDGQTIYFRNRSASLDSVTFRFDDENGFYYSGTYASLYKINGNVKDVQTFDWSLPGFITSQDTLRGGLLIWHIDETVIESKIASNSINNNPDRRGVDLEEAKGAQEIGVTFSTPFGNITGDGTAVDYWYNGGHSVPSNVYKNEFTPSSIPSSRSYSLSNNNIAITAFSRIDTLMTFKVIIGSPSLSPVAGFPKFIGTDTTGNAEAVAFDFDGDGTEDMLVNSGADLLGYKANGAPLRDTGVLIRGFGNFAPVLSEQNGVRYALGINGAEAKLINSSFNEQIFTLPGSSPVSTAPLVLSDDGSVILGRENGALYKFSLSSPLARLDSAAGPVNQLARARNADVKIASGDVKYAVIGALTGSASTDLVTVNNAGEILINSNKLNIAYQTGAISSPPTLADLNGDGRQEIIFCAGGKIYAINSNGVLIENFPARVNAKIVSGISVCDVNADGKYDVLFVSDEGDLYAYGTDGKVVPNYPVKIGPATTSTPALANLGGTLGIVVAGGDGYIYAFKTDVAYNPANVLWKNFQNDRYLANNNFITGANAPSFTEKLPSDRAYNWPNPVYDNNTFIRYYLNGSAGEVKIKILDLSGELVTELSGTSNSNADNEVPWNVSEVQSGVYYARIEAVIDGSAETKIIKIAVVK